MINFPNSDLLFLYKPVIHNAPFLYPLIRFSDVLRRWRKGALGTNGLKTQGQISKKRCVEKFCSCDNERQSQYLVRLVSLCRLPYSHSPRPPIKGLLPPTGSESTPGHATIGDFLPEYF